jgi:hypothetical protein
MDKRIKNNSDSDPNNFFSRIVFLVDSDEKQKTRLETVAARNWRFNAQQTHLWLIKVWFSASTFVVRIATFAKPGNVTGN